MSPFDSALAEESEEVLISMLMSLKRNRNMENRPCMGRYPHHRDFSIQYEVANAGGASINASVTVEIGEIHIQEQPINPTLFASGIRKSANGVNVDSGTIPSSTKISVTLSASTIVFMSGRGCWPQLLGRVDDESTITADIPLVDLLIQ